MNNARTKHGAEAPGLMDWWMDWRQQNTTFEEVGAFRSWSFNFTGGDRLEVVRGLYVSASLFTVLKQEPLLGRIFLPEEDQPGDNRVAVLSHGLWQRSFGGDQSRQGNQIFAQSARENPVGVLCSILRRRCADAADGLRARRAKRGDDRGRHSPGCHTDRTASDDPAVAKIGKG